jgi:hypothetical protein
MSLAERCDEIVRLIKAAIGEPTSDLAGADDERPWAVHTDDGRWRQCTAGRPRRREDGSSAAA